MTPWEEAYDSYGAPGNGAPGNITCTLPGPF